jgi:hypothetical protein
MQAQHERSCSIPGWRRLDGVEQALYSEKQMLFVKGLAFVEAEDMPGEEQI